MPILPKKKRLKKWSCLDQNHGLIPLEKVNVNFSTFLTSCFYNLERRFFVLEYHKRHFPGLYFLKKKVGKMANFGAKPWANPFGKISIFDFLNLLFFYLRRAFFVLEYHKRHFPGLYCLKQKSWKNGHFWTKTMG